MTLTHKVAIRASNGKYLSAEGGGNGDIHANRDTIGPWEVFEVSSLEEDQVRIRASNGSFWCAEGGGGASVSARRDIPGRWETFRLIHVDGDGIQLQTADGHFVCAEGGGGGAVVANRQSAGAWETFSFCVPPQDLLGPGPARIQKRSPGFIIRNDTQWPLQISLNQVGPLYWDVVQPGHFFVRDTGAVWFTIHASVFADESQRITTADAVLPVAGIIGSVLVASVTAGLGAIAVAGAAGAAGLSLGASTLAGSLVAAGFTSTSALFVGGALVGGGVAAASESVKAALRDVFKDENVGVSKAGCYAGPPWPLQKDLSLITVSGGPIVEPFGKDGFNLIGQPLRLNGV